MNILYIVGKGSKHKNLELRMSLRSICKYGSNIGKVVIAGYPPNWISKEAECISVPDTYMHKHLNIMKCIETAVKNHAVEGEFLYSSDDHFYVKPVDFDHYPYFYKAEELPAVVRPGDKFFKYHYSLKATRKLLEKYQMPIKNYSQHCNTHMLADVFFKFPGIIEDSYQCRYGVEPTSMIMNLWATLPNAPKCVKRQDIKLVAPKLHMSIIDRIGERDCFSIGDNIFSNSDIFTFFKDEYGEKCRFEM